MTPRRMMVDFYGFHVGIYTSPMDHIGTVSLCRVRWVLAAANFHRNIPTNCCMGMSWALAIWVCCFFFGLSQPMGLKLIPSRELTYPLLKAF